MSIDVLCLRPEADFQRTRALPPDSLRVCYRAPDDSDLAALMKQTRGLLIPAVGPKLPAELFHGSSVKFVQVTGAGVDRIDQALMKRMGIAVANVPGGSNSAVAEYAVTAASLLLRRFGWASSELKKGDYVGVRARLLADNLSGIDGLLVGVVGLGVIGLAVAKAFHARGGRICYYDPAPRDREQANSMGAESVSLPQLLSTSDVVTLHVPLIPATNGLIGDQEIARMKPGAVLIHAARGGVVDEAALARHLQSGHLGGAAVDVFSTEPPKPDNPLLALSGDAAQTLLLTPHIAGVTRQSATFLLRSAWQNLERVLVLNQPPQDRVY
ncbi:MAG TPA: NAD(P)-dependent oxidoreductase [Terriglobales bacterium]